MSQLNSDQLGELTERMNARLDEFGGDFGHWTPGFVRLAYDVIMEWQDGQPMSLDDAMAARLADGILQDAFHAGYQRGKQANVPKDDTPRLVTNGAPEPPADAPPKSDAHEVDTQHPTNGYHPVATAPAQEDTKPVAGSFPTGPFGDWPPGDDPQYQAVPVSMINLPRTLAEGDATSPKLSAQAAATLGPEHVNVTPLRVPDPDTARANLAAAVATGDVALSHRKPRTLAEVDGLEDGEEEDVSAAVSGMRMTKDERAADLRATIYALQEMAVGGVMPSMTDWQRNRPDGMLTAQGIMGRHNLTWNELAAYAKLKPNERTPRKSGK